MAVTASSSKKKVSGTQELEKTKRVAVASKARAARLKGVPAKQAYGFVEFIREKGVVGLAVGLALGTAASGLVTQIVNAVITPLVGLMIGKDGLKGLDATVTIGERSEVFAFGLLLDALIKFLAIAAVIYFVVMGLKLDRLDKKKE